MSGHRRRVGGVAVHERRLGRRGPLSRSGRTDPGRWAGWEPRAGSGDAAYRVDHKVEVRTVSESDIRSAMAFSAHKMGLVLEGAGAVGVAALRSGVISPDAEGAPTIVLLTGRNVAPKLLSEVLHDS